MIFNIRRNHDPRTLLDAAIEVIRSRGENPAELRLERKTAYQLERRFEVRTLHSKYYSVFMRGSKIKEVTSIEGFQLDEDSSALVAKIDPYNQSVFNVSISQQ